MDDDYPDSQQETKRKKIYKAMSDRIVHVYNNLKADIRDEESKGSKYKDYMKEISELVDKIPTRPINRGDEEDELEGVNSGSEFFAATSLGRTLHENAGNPWTSYGDAAAGSTQGASFNAARVWPGAHSTAAAGSSPNVRPVAAAGSTQGANPNAAGVRPVAPSTAAASRNQPDSQDILQKAWASVAPRPVENTTPSSSAPEVSGNKGTFFQRWLPSWTQSRVTAAATDPKAAAETDPKAAAATDPKAAAATDPKAAAATGPKAAAATGPKAAAAAVSKAAAATGPKAAAAAVSKPAEQPIVTPAAPSQGRLNLYESDDGNFRGTLEEVLAYEKSAASQPATIVDASQPATIVDASQPATTNDPAATEEAVAFGLRDGELPQDTAHLNVEGDLNQISFQGEGTKMEGGFAFSAKHKPHLVTKGTIRFLDSTRPTSSAATASKSISKTKAQGGKFTKKETIAKSHRKKITFNVKSKRPTKKTIKKEIKFKVGASR
jgi:hypothetical protein